MIRPEPAPAAPTKRAAPLRLVPPALALLLPSTGVVQKYLGLSGVGLYLLLGMVVLWLLQAHYTNFANLLRGRRALWLSAATFLLLAALFSTVYPLDDAGIVGGGSDRDDALNLATTELLSGRYPYYAETYLGNPISPLPGALLLALPFVLLGNSAYQNFFWLLAFLLSMGGYLRDPRAALLLLWTVLASSPIVLQELVTGGDLLANSIYVTLAVLWLVTATGRSDAQRSRRLLLAVFLGVALASRANFILLLPLVIAALWRRHSPRAALEAGAVAALTLLLLVVPFYLYDPQGFSPLHTAGELGRFAVILPLAGVTLPLATALLALALSSRRANATLPGLLGHCTLVLALPVISGAVLQSVALRTLDFSFAGFGIAFLFFGAAAYWPRLKSSNMGIDTLEHLF